VAGPPTNTSYRSVGVNPLPLVAKHREKQVVFKQVVKRRIMMELALPSVAGGRPPYVGVVYWWNTKPFVIFGVSFN
jgi:hypothetical protein